MATIKKGLLAKAREQKSDLKCITVSDNHPDFIFLHQCASTSELLADTRPLEEQVKDYNEGQQLHAYKIIYLGEVKTIVEIVKP